MSKSANTPEKELIEQLVDQHRRGDRVMKPRLGRHFRMTRDECLDSALGASFPVIGTLAPSQPSGNRDHRPTSNETIAVPSAASTGHRATAERRDTSQTVTSFGGTGELLPSAGIA